MANPTTLVAIETSCDETGIAVVQKKGNRVEVIADTLASQIAVHKGTGGVVPEIAAREHVTALKPMIHKILSDVKSASVDAIAVTVGPGLMPALSIGVTAARTLAYAIDKPIVPVHHLEGHIYSALLAPRSRPWRDFAGFPTLALVVSGGHTLLVEVTGHLQYKVIGQTRDDAAGEAFDKVARMLGLPYPGGPHISKLAEQGNPDAYAFTVPMRESGDLDFSFSGLKTEVLYTLRAQAGEAVAADIAASFQKIAVASLVLKTKQALQKKAYKSILLTGGVAANTLLRSRLQILAKEEGIELRLAPRELCTDNAVMIGQVGVFAFEAGRIASWQNVEPKARVSLAQVPTALMHSARSES